VISSRICSCSWSGESALHGNSDVDLIEVEVPHAIHPEQARKELDLYLNVWKKLRAASLFEIEA